MPGCLHCEEMKAELRKWAPKVPDLRIRIFNLAKEENKKLDEALSLIYQVPEAKRLADHKLYMGEDYLWSEELHLESFQKLVAKYQGKGAPPPWEKVTTEALQKGEKSIIERFKKWSLSAVLIAGFMDGINPCAFATIIFLVSYLTFAGKKAGKSFSTGPFSPPVFLLLYPCGNWTDDLSAPNKGFPIDQQRGLSLYCLLCFNTWDDKPL